MLSGSISNSGLYFAFFMGVVMIKLEGGGDYKINIGRHFDEDMSHTKCCGMYLFCCGGDGVWKEG